ncbi:MAG: hypothetical protein IPP88_16585 [Betaproteobacteria bacterium]|nr:hypothetical protein [Betaproteobacteria bacterium]
MVDPAILVGVVAAVALYAAWREYAWDNRRDAALLATFGASVMLAAIWLANSDGPQTLT